MQIGIPKESDKAEKRVAATPNTVAALKKLNFDLVVMEKAGVSADFSDDLYKEQGASLGSESDVWQSDIILKVNAPTPEELELAKPGATLISFASPYQNQELIEQCKSKNMTLMAMDAVPRLSRSQSMDALSSMANIAGYRAVVEAMNLFGRLFTGQITAAGNMPPAKVLVIGAGVAGLAAIGTASSLGAVVRAFDTRPEVKEQIESMGASFLELDYEEDADSSDGYAKEMSQAFIDAEMALFLQQAQEVDIIITTAAIPGKKAPTLITKEMVNAMKPGSIIVDLAAATGGNCEHTKPGKLTTVNGVKIIGYTDMVSRLPNQSSQLYSQNLVNLLKLLCKEKNGEIDINFEDEVIRGMTVVKSGEVTWPPPPIKVSKVPQKEETKPQETEEQAQNTSKGYVGKFFGILSFGAIAWSANYAPPEFLGHMTVFVLSCVIGYHVIWNVTHALHTPLMSVTNAISGIIIVGALLQIGSDNEIVRWLSFIAVLIASINIVGGFMVTQRMLKMFRK